MRVLLQWTKASPTDWETLDLTEIRQWRQLPKKNEPVGGETIDNSPGWLYDANIQGVLIGGADHYSARLVPSVGVMLIRWNDDPEDWPVGTRNAQEWTFAKPAPDQRHGGAMNTVQYLTCYNEDPALQAHWAQQSTSGGPVTSLPWSSFVPPAANLTIHGIWVPDTLSDLHRNTQSVRGWKEWIEP